MKSDFELLTFLKRDMCEILNCSSEIVTFKVRDCSLEEEAGCEESVDGVSGKVSQTSETSDK